MRDDRPRLRPVEAFPVEHEGTKLIGVRDPARYTSAVLVLPVGLLEIVALLDGNHSLADIQAEIMRRHGELLQMDQLEGIIETLDQQGFIDSARFAARRAAIDDMFLGGATRPAVHAGGAYAADADELRRAMDAFFVGVDGPGEIEWASRAARLAAPPVTGVIAPHIDFPRGGPAYAWAYRDLAERCEADLFVIFGTCHTGMRDPFALTRKDYETPLGPAVVDGELVEKVAARAAQDCFGSELAHRTEHSIEFQAVFLRYLYGERRDFTIVPVLTSFAHESLARGQRPADDRRVARFLDALGETIAASGRRAVVIAGADLAHMGPRFGDPAPISTAERGRIEREDRRMLEVVEAGDGEGFFESVAADGDRRRICGLSPIYALLRTLGGAKGVVRRYGQWPDPQGVVTFASVVFPV